MSRSLALLSLLVACGGDKEPTDTDKATPTDTEPTTESGTPAPDETVVVAEALRYGPGPYDPDGSTGAYSTFLEDDGGSINPIDCFISGYCFDELGGVGSQPTLSYGPSQIFREGGEMSIGDIVIPSDANYQIDGVFDIAWPTQPGEIVTTGGADVPAYSGGAEVVFPVMNLTSPSPADFVVVGPAEPVDLTWTPDASGEVLITVFAPTGSSFLRPDDDGSTQVPANTFGFSGIIDAAYVLVSRVAHGQEAIDELNSLDWFAQDAQVLYLDFRNLGSIPEMDSTQFAEDCSGVGAIPPITTSGDWFVNTHLATNELDLDLYNPLTTYPTPGGEVLVPVALLPSQTLNVTWRTTFADASLYLLDASCDPSAGLTGSDSTYANEEEDISYTATLAETVYIVLDEFDVGSPGLLEIEIQ